MKAESKYNVAAESFLTKAIGSSITPASKGAAGPTAAGSPAFVGATVAGHSFTVAAVLVTGHILKFVQEAKNKTDQHNNAKKIEKFFAGYDPEDAKWIKFLVSVFDEIFKAYNVQVCFNYYTVNVLSAESTNQIPRQLAVILTDENL